MADNMNLTEHEPERYEERDVRRGPLLAVAAGLAALVVVCSLVGWWVYGWLARDLGRTPPGLRQATPQNQQQLAEGVDPALPLLSYEELEDLRAWEDKQLTRYGWVNEAEGIVHVPIDEAMKIMLERQATAPSAAATPPETESE